MNKIGLLRHNGIKGFRRDFTPKLIKRVVNLLGVKKIFLENGYGNDIGFNDGNYFFNKNIEFHTRNFILHNSDFILSLTGIDDKEIEFLNEGQTLVSFLHYPTHPKRNILLNSRNINVVSLDELKDFRGERLIEDFETTAYNAMTEGFIQLRKALGEEYWSSRSRKHITVYIMGFGQVGKYAVEAALKMGKTNFQEELKKNGGNFIVEVVPTTSYHSEQRFYLQKIISKSLITGGSPHILVDVSQRKILSQHFITEDVISMLPKETIIVDITADRYEDSSVVKAIQGIPTGSEKQYVFLPDDEAWENQLLVPRQYQLKTDNRRVVVSHYAWPSYGTVADRIYNMEKYANQLLPILEKLQKMNLKDLKQYNLNEWSLEKAIYQSTLNYFLEKNGLFSTHQQNPNT